MLLYQVLMVMAFSCLGFSVDICIYEDDPDYAGYDDNLMLSVVCSSEQPSLTWAAGDILIDPGPDLTLIIEHHCIQNGSRVDGERYRFGVGSDFKNFDIGSVLLNYSISPIEDGVVCEYYGCMYHEKTDFFYLFEAVNCTYMYVPGKESEVSISVSQTVTPSSQYSTTHSLASHLSPRTIVVGRTSPSTPQASNNPAPIHNPNPVDPLSLWLSVVSAAVLIVILVTALSLAGMRMHRLRMKKESQYEKKVIQGLNTDPFSDSFNPVSTEPVLQLSVSTDSIHTLLDKFGVTGTCSPDVQSLNMTAMEKQCLYERVSESLGCPDTLPNEQQCLGEGTGKHDLKNCHFVNLGGSEYVYFDSTTDSSGYDSNSYFSVTKDYNTELRTLDTHTPDTLEMYDQIHPIDSGMCLEEYDITDTTNSNTDITDTTNSNTNSYNVESEAAKIQGDVCGTEHIMSKFIQNISRTESSDSSLTSNNSSTVLLKATSTSV